jgi:hypothetical protein
MLWSPGLEARRVQKDLNVRSLEETIAAAERAGYEVCYVDLPDKVSGYATVIEGKPFIVVNRAKPRHHIHYTVSHELGHHVLHLSPSRRPDPSWIPPSTDLQEFEAHMFAVTWVRAACDKEGEEVLRQNPESMILPLVAFGSLAVVLFALLANIASRVFHKQPAQSDTNR